MPSTETDASCRESSVRRLRTSSSIPVGSLVVQKNVLTNAPAPMSALPLPSGTTSSSRHELRGVALPRILRGLDDAMEPLHGGEEKAVPSRACAVQLHGHVPRTLLGDLDHGDGAGWVSPCENEKIVRETNSDKDRVGKISGACVVLSTDLVQRATDPFSQGGGECMFGSL